MLIIWGLPKLTKAIPASLIAILAVCIIAILLCDSSDFQSVPAPVGN
jgi:MFS superfamily sulfate permease-like transporter